MRYKRITLGMPVIVSVFLWTPFQVVAEEPSAPAEAGAEPSASRTSELAVAVLDFSANAPGDPELGSQISEALAAMLSGEPGFRLVDRATLTRAVQEMELNLSGVVDAEQAVKVGKVVGARILVVGKAFPMGEQMFITAKIVGTETSLVDGVIVKGALDADIGELIVELAEKLADRLRTKGPELVARADAGQDPVPGLKAKLAALTKPTVAVIIPERHMTQRTPAPDPAVETEIKRLLRECGFTVKDVKQNELADFARDLAASGRRTWPQSLAGVDVVIVGEGFSEFAARIGNLVSCAARVEVNVIRRKDGAILIADRITQRGVDLSENIAAKKALENAGRALGIRILEYWAEVLSAVKSEG